MAGKGMGKTRIVLLLVVLLVAALCCVATAFAAEEDEKMLRDLPGKWFENEEGTEVVMTFGEDGTMSLYCSREDKGLTFTCEGTWSFEILEDYHSQITLLFTSTDNPAYAGTEYNVECIYTIYPDTWVQNDTMYHYILFTEVSSTGTTPFEDAYDYNDAALHREQGPNMKVVNCKEYVSLREEASTKSTRLAKVPLGAVVYAFIDEGEYNGFFWCTYHDEYGFILADYLEMIE